MNRYIIWIEGLHYKTGEKIHTLSNFDHTYTTYMTEAMRVNATDRSAVREILKRQGIAENFITFIPTTYTPKNTLYRHENVL